MKKKVLIMLLILSLVLVAAFGLVACDLIGKKPSKEEGKTPAVKLELGELSYNEETRVLSWDKVENVREYELTVKEGEREIGRYRIESNLTSHTLNIEQSGNYTVLLRAMGDNRNYKDSDVVSKDINYIAPTVSDAAVKLQAPQNLKYSLTTQLVSWDSVQNALRYEITINGRTYFTEKTTFDMSTRTDSTYTLYVRAIGDNVKYFLNSDKSSITFEKETIVEKVPLGIVKKIFIEDFEEEGYNKIISWSRCNDADGYELVVNGESYFLDCIDANAYAFRGEPGHYEVKVRAIANEENEKYISGEYTVLEGGFDIILTYSLVMQELGRKIRTAMENKVRYPRVNEIIGIDAQNDLVYFIHNDCYVANAHLSGIRGCYTLDDLYQFVKNFELTEDDVTVATSNVISENEAQLLAKYVINKGCVSSLQGYTLDDVNWCVARSFFYYDTSTTRVDTVIVTNDGKVILLELTFQGRIGDFEQLTVQTDCEVTNEYVNDYTDFSDRFV